MPQIETSVLVKYVELRYLLYKKVTFLVLL